VVQDAGVVVKDDDAGVLPFRIALELPIRLPNVISDSACRGYSDGTSGSHIFSSFSIFLVQIKLFNLCVYEQLSKPDLVVCGTSAALRKAATSDPSCRAKFGEVLF